MSSLRDQLVIVLVATGLLYACPPSPLVPPPDAADASPIPSTPDAAPTPAQDASLEATPAPAPKDAYEAACGRLSALGCPEANTLPGGRTCADTMRATANLFDIRAECLSKASDVAGVRACCAGGKFDGGVCSSVKCAGR